MTTCVPKTTDKEYPYTKTDEKFLPKDNPYDKILCIDDEVALFQDDDRFILQDDFQLVFNK